MDHLAEAQEKFRNSKDSLIRKKWVENYKRNLLYYEGDQWQNSNFSKELREIKASEYTANQISRILNLYTSLQIRSGKRPNFNVEDDISNESFVIDSLKQLNYKMQAKSDYTFNSSLKFTNLLISGIGCSSYQQENNDTIPLYENIDPFEIFLDPDDTTPRYTKSSFIGRSYFSPLHECERVFPKFKKYFRELVEGNTSSDITQTTASAIDLDQWTLGKSIRLVEIQTKKLEKGYKITVITGEREFLQDFKKRSFLIFKDQLELSTANVQEHFPDSEIIIEEKQVSRIYQTIYSGDNLLEHRPLPIQVPDQKRFSYLPVVLYRDSEGVPYGVINLFIPLQDMRNYLYSSLLHYMDAKTLIVNLSANVLPADRANMETAIRRELSLKRGIIYSQSEKDYKLHEHSGEIIAKLQLLEQNSKDFEVLSGLYNNELSGIENKNMSGVAINMRTINSMNAQNHILLAYDAMLVEEGYCFLDFVKSVVDAEVSFKYKQDGKVQIGQIDFTHKTLNYAVYVEIGSNFLSNAEEDRVRFNEILNSPNAAMLMSSELFLKMSGFSGDKASEIVKEFKKLNEQQNQGQPEAGDQPLPQELAMLNTGQS